ncbi:MAG: MEDS domain-containing protein, partial [Thermoproteota archaeon]|nr:MEDS domain-containing protein [Thermoproteota archaeon]
RRDWYYVHLPKLLIKRVDQFLQTPRAKSMGMSNKPELLRHLINQFLDEQEALYNRMDYVGDVILEMKDRDHMVFTYNNESQFKEIVNAHVRRGVDRNQINVLLIYTKEQQKFIESMDKVENVNLLFNSQDIIIIPADECFSDDGSFSVLPCLNSMGNIVELAKQKSKNGLNVLATLPTKLIEQGRYEEALQLENVSDEAIKELEMPITVLCLYKAVPENLEDRFSEYHDLIIKRTALLQGLQ